MSSDLHEQLADLAGDAPKPAPGGAGELWAAGKRRQRRRTAVAAVGMVSVVIGVVGVGLSLLPVDHTDPPPTTPAVEKLRLPKHIHEPAKWSKGTADAGQIGPLAALASAERRAPEGLFGDRQADPQAPFGVSAVDGTVRFIDIPLARDERLGVPWVDTTLSPDGRKIGFVRYARDGQQADMALGWGVFDTVTGKVRAFTDSQLPVVSGTCCFEIAFTGDSRYLLTNYSRKQPATNYTDELVAWDVETGDRTVAEGPGKYWLPNLGSGPTGVVWSRGAQVLQFDPASGARSTMTMERPVVMASFGPGDVALAYVGAERGPHGGMRGPRELYVGESTGEQRRGPWPPFDLRSVPLPGDVGAILGWADATHVVVATGQGDYVIVDVVSGKQREGRIGGNLNFYGDPVADLWANPLAGGVKPAQLSDPRTPMRWAVAFAGLFAVVALSLAMRWRRG